MNNTVVSLVRVFLILIVLAVSAFGQAGGDEAFAVEDLATAALMTSAGSIGVINTAPPCFASKVRNRCWINVSTTCGSGWVGLQNSKSIEISQCSSPTHPLPQVVLTLIQVQRP
jgi:hypothetical protein